MKARIARLAGAAAAIAIGVVILWQVGVIFDDEDTAGDVDLLPADTSVETIAPDGVEVGLQVGDAAPNFEFSSYTGERLSLADFRGRPVLINFWATWCGPCRAEMPAIDEALRRYEADGFAVIAMNAGESYSRATNWLQDLGLQFTAFGHDPEQDVYDLYFDGGIAGLPISYFIDAEGIITEKVLGPLRVSDLDFAIEKAIAGFDSSPD